MFVGRDGELAQLATSLAEAAAGRGGFVAVAGEPGIGKTRLLEELIARAGLADERVLWGRCLAHEGVPPYWPWTQAVRSFVERCEPAALRADLGPGAADIAQLVPEVRERLPDIGTAPRLDPEQALTFEDEFDAVFSNASLHWMKRADHVIVGVWRALRPGGRFVGELGGAGCVATIQAALIAALDRRGVDGAALDPWYFPDVDSYRGRLEAAGFRGATADGKSRTICNRSRLERETSLAHDGDWRVQLTFDASGTSITGAGSITVAASTAEAKTTAVAIGGRFDPATGDATLVLEPLAAVARAT